MEGGKGLGKEGGRGYIWDEFIFEKEGGSGKGREGEGEEDNENSQCDSAVMMPWGKLPRRGGEKIGGLVYTVLKAFGVSVCEVRWRAGREGKGGREVAISDSAL